MTFVGCTIRSGLWQLLWSLGAASVICNSKTLKVHIKDPAATVLLPLCVWTCWQWSVFILCLSSSFCCLTRIFFFFKNVYGCFACMYVNVPYVCLMPKEVKRECRSPVSGDRLVCEPSYRWWELKLGPLQEQQVLVNTEPSLQPWQEFSTHISGSAGELCSILQGSSILE